MTPERLVRMSGCMMPNMCDVMSKDDGCFAMPFCPFHRCGSVVLLSYTPPLNLASFFLCPTAFARFRYLPLLATFSSLALAAASTVAFCLNSNVRRLLKYSIYPCQLKFNSYLTPKSSREEHETSRVRMTYPRSGTTTLIPLLFSVTWSFTRFRPSSDDPILV